MDDLVLAEATRQQIDSLLQKVKLHEILCENFGLGKVDLSVRRIIGHIEMPLPTKQGRMQLYQKMIPAEYPLGITDEELYHIVCHSEGLSGAEILNVVINAATFALNREGIQCLVRLQDFELAIEGVKKAKKANCQI